MGSSRSHNGSPLRETPLRKKCTNLRQDYSETVSILLEMSISFHDCHLREIILRAKHYTRLTVKIILIIIP